MGSTKRALMLPLRDTQGAAGPFRLSDMLRGGVRADSRYL